jgi:ubiquinone biosynthesis protein
MLLIKALVTIEGVGLRLDPTFKIVEHAAPLAERLWRDQYRPDILAHRAWRNLQHSLSAARRLSLHLEAIGRKVRDGRLEIRFVHRNLDHFVREMDRSSNRLAFALIIAALIVGSSLIIRNQARDWDHAFRATLNGVDTGPGEPRRTGRPASRAS